MSEVKKYSRKLKTQTVHIDDESWTLRELSGSLRNQYLNANAKKVTTKNGVEVKNFTGLCSDLLVLCLFNPAGSTVPAEEIDSWPSEMQMDLFKDAIKLSGLDKKSEDEEKKD